MPVLERVLRRSLIALGWIGILLVGAGERAIAEPFAGALPQSFFNQPANFTAQEQVGMAGIFTSCGGFMNAAVQNLGAGMMGAMQGAGAMCPMPASFGLDTQCGSDEVGDTNSLTCDSAAMSPMAIQQTQMMYQMALCAVQCKRGKMQAIQGEISCLAAQANMLTQKIQSLSNVYAQNFMRMRNEVAQIDTIIKDRDSQLRNVTEKLNGTPGAGNPGLLKLQEQTKTAINKMPENVQTARSSYQSIVQSQKVLDEQIEVRKMNLTMSCFGERKNDSFRCEPNGPPVTAPEYLKCRFHQNQLLGRGGVIERNATTTKQAEARAQGLSSLLEQIVGDTASREQSAISTVGADGKMSEDQAKSMEAPLQVLSVADIDSMYGAQLENYKIGNTSARSFVMQMMKSCNGRADRQTNLEKSRANTKIGMQALAIRQKQQEFNTGMETMYQGYSQLYAENMSGLIGQSTPFDVSQCTGAAPPVQINCLDNMKKQLQGQLSGSTKNSTMNINIPGTNPLTTIKLTCQGINGCVTQMQNVVAGLKTEKERLDTFKRNYLIQARTSTEAFTRQMAGQLGPQSMMLTNQLKALNTALASMGGQGIHVDPLQPEQMKFDENGLPVMPNNLLNVIGGAISPPLPNVSGDGFGRALSGMASIQTRTEQNYTRLNQALINVQNLMKSCQVKGLQARLDHTVDMASQAQNCRGHDVCKTNSVDTLSNSISRITHNASLLNMPSAAALEFGVTSACEQGLEKPDRKNYGTTAAEQARYDQDQKDFIDTMKFNPPRYYCAALNQINALDKQFEAVTSKTKRGGRAGVAW